MKDDFENYSSGLISPAGDATAIVPDDAATLDMATRALFVGEAGDVHVRMVSGQTIVLKNVQAGVVYPLRVAQVMATDTPAGGLVGLR